MRLSATKLPDSTPILPELSTNLKQLKIGILPKGIWSDLVEGLRAPLGALLAGIPGGLIGLRLTILIEVPGVMFAGTWFLLSPVRKAELRAYLSSLFEAILLAGCAIKPGFRQPVTEETR